MTSHNNQKKAAIINDFTGFGRCSIAVALPILSAMKIQCCPLPTAIFSNHTGFPSCAWTDYTDHMAPYMAQWEKLGLEFQAISIGFLGSDAQIDLVKQFLTTFKGPDTIAVIDPVMGDYGSLYATYTPALAERMGELVRFADILTPNLTEACILTGRAFCPVPSEAELTAMCDTLSDLGPGKIVISGLELGAELGNFVYERGKTPRLLTQPKVGDYRSGTGDVFSAILTGDAVNGVAFADSVEHAAAFVARAIQRSIELEIPLTDGIAFEELLGELVPGGPTMNSSKGAIDP
ncbi:MAG: pyridoxamine kinase [Clostridiales bacterium]|nr:pyridoxamine kinase [Clostridiales bacterium]